MEFGFTVPTRGPMASREALEMLARKGEEMGFGIVGVSDHVVIPRDISSRYPYNESGEFAGRASGECLEQLATLSFLAGVTSSIRLMTSVMVLPHRPAVLTAKALATIDALSHGRLYVGCGVGWMREEFEALGAPPYDERGAVGDEYIRAFRELWTSDDPSFKGRHVSFSNITFAPKPEQRPHPPIWVGGESPAALRRAARLGDGWYPIGSNPRYPVGTLDQFKGYVSRLLTYAREAGRDPYAIDLAFNCNWYDDREAHHLQSGDRRPFTGTSEQIAGDVKAFEEQGLRHLVLNVQGNTLDDTLARMERIADKVMPLV